MNKKKIAYCLFWILLVPLVAYCATLKISGGTVTLPTGSVTDDAISGTISADKLKHIYKASSNFDLAVGGTPATKEQLVFVASNAGTIRGFHFLLADTGTSTSIAWDLKKNGTTVLTGTGSSTNSDTDGQVKDGTISSASFVADDRFTIAITVSTSTGAQGPFAWAEFEESAP